MLDQARARTHEFQRRLKGEGIEIAVITDESSIAYLAGFGVIFPLSLAARPF